MMKTFALAVVVVAVLIGLSICDAGNAMAQVHQAGAGVAPDGKLVLDSLQLDDKIMMKLIRIPAGKSGLYPKSSPSPVRPIDVKRSVRSFKRQLVWLLNPKAVPTVQPGSKTRRGEVKRSATPG